MNILSATFEKYFRIGKLEINMKNYFGSNISGIE